MDWHELIGIGISGLMVLLAIGMMMYVVAMLPPSSKAFARQHLRMAGMLCLFAWCLHASATLKYASVCQAKLKAVPASWNAVHEHPAITEVE